MQLKRGTKFTYNSDLQSISITSDQDSVLVCYRVLPLELFKNLGNRPLSQYDPSETAPSSQSQITEELPLFDFGKRVETAGFISRGITFGNRQNLFVNSTLNLQMNGKISDNLSIEALITDQNIPFQPEGNTQQIRDFDNVYIKLYNQNFEMIAGDVVLTNPLEKDYFLKYYKNVQGLQLSYKSKIGNWNSYTSVATSASKGKFASIALEAREGVQGPYQLRGPNGERFIVVLANSERVFLDGVMLERGFDRDYVIDYNLGQIIFNTNVLITQFSVLRVDFEYAEQFYTRTSSAIAQSLKNKSTEIRINHYQEKDNAFGSFGFQPSDNDLDILRSIGDNTELAQVSGVDSVSYSPDRILYEEKDTVDLDGISSQIFIYSTDPDAAFFSVFFTEVGFGNGDYVLSSSTANGQVYEWVSPQGGQSQGNYAAARKVPLPISKRMTTFGVENQISAHESVSNEIAISTVDQNLYSSIDDGDNQAIGWAGFLKSEGRELGNGYKMKASLNWEIDQSGFRAMDRYRPILFDRDWDIQTDTTLTTDLIVSLQAAVEKNESQKISYNVVRRDRPEVLDGWQHRFGLNQKVGNLHLESDNFYLKNELQALQSDWVRSLTDVSFRKGRLVPGYIYSVDQNQKSLGDSVVASQMYYSAHELYLTNSDSSNSRYRFSYQIREDQSPKDGKMEEFTFSENYRASYSRKFRDHDLELTGSLRKIENRLTNQTDEWLNTRLNWFGKFFQENVTNRLTYQIGNVRELRRNFIFIEVGGNQGTHAWRDENGDGIKDLNEFYEAINPDERQYAKFFTLTDDFVSAFETRFQNVVDFRFPRKWRSSMGIRKFLSRWNGRISINAHFKTTASAIHKRLDPFSLELSEEDVLFAANRWNYNLQYNQFEDGLGWEGTRSLTQRKQLLTNGFELGERSEWSMGTRWRFSREYTITFRNEWSRHLNSSDFLANRNLNISSYGLGPEFTWQPSNTFRVVSGFFYENRVNNRSENMVTSNLSEWFSRITWNKLQKGNLNGQIRSIRIDYDGELNSFTSYQMLEGLRPGLNTTWRLNWQQTLGKGIQMTLQYNGRSSENQAPIHTGTMIFTAFF